MPRQPDGSRPRHDVGLDDRGALGRRDAPVDLEGAVEHVQRLVAVRCGPLDRAAVVELGAEHPQREPVGAHDAATDAALDAVIGGVPRRELLLADADDLDLRHQPSRSTSPSA